MREVFGGGNSPILSEKTEEADWIDQKYRNELEVFAAQLNHPKVSNAMKLSTSSITELENCLASSMNIELTDK